MRSSPWGLAEFQVYFPAKRSHPAIMKGSDFTFSIASSCPGCTVRLRWPRHGMRRLRQASS